MKKEEMISREKVLCLLRARGRQKEWDPAGDYYHAVLESGIETVTLWGSDDPLIVGLQGEDLSG